MAQIAVDPILLKDVLLSLGTDSYEKHVSAVEFVPTAQIVNWKGLNPTSKFSFPTDATWVCNLTYAQDWETLNSLSRYLLENAGEEVAATFEPVNGGAGFTATLIIVPGAIGGPVDSVAVATVSLGVKGTPVYVPAV